MRNKSVLPFLLFLIIIQFILIVYLLPKKRMPRIIKPPKPVAVAIKGKIAIVLDDWGYNLNNAQELYGIKQRLTIAILPQLPFSRELAQDARTKGREIILHLPLEPYEHNGLEQNTIMTGMDEKQIAAIMESSLKDVLYAKGINNHMGSKATEDYKTMEIILRQIKQKRLYFLDSFTSPNSICREVAGRIGARYIRRDVFLDNREDEEYIRKQLNKLKNKAAKLGAAIGIGHDRKVTLRVLKEELPKIEQEGFRFVFVSELVK